MSHTFSVKVLEKRHSEKGPYWIDLTDKKVVDIGTTNPEFIGKRSFITMKYRQRGDNNRFSLDAKSKNLLIPVQYTKDRRNGRILSRNADEYLVVDKQHFGINGKDCDKIGVGPIAFFHQKDRCSMPAGNLIFLFLL